MAQPRQGLERILAHAGEPVAPEAFSFLGSDAVGDFANLGVDHTVAGNPMRFHQGRLDLRLDQAWTTKLPARDRKVVTAITWPLQLRYGYSNRSPKSQRTRQCLGPPFPRSASSSPPGSGLCCSTGPSGG